MRENSDAPFAKGIALAADPSNVGHYVGEIDDSWLLAVTPQGGLVAAIAANAMTCALATPDQQLRSMTVVFAGQVHVGPVDVAVTVLRKGRSVSQLAATVTNPGSSAGLSAIAVFGASRPGFAFTDLAYPTGGGDLTQARSSREPWPDDVEAPPFEPRPFWESIVEHRYVGGHPPWESYVPVSSEQLLWTRFDQPPFLEGGVQDPLGYLVLADIMPGAVGRRMGNDSPQWFGPSADLTFHWFAETQSDWVLIRNHARWAGDGYASVSAELWDPTNKVLLGYATQQMIFTFSDEVPVGDARFPIDLRSA